MRSLVPRDDRKERDGKVVEWGSSCLGMTDGRDGMTNGGGMKKNYAFIVKNVQKKMTWCKKLRVIILIMCTS